MKKIFVGILVVLIILLFFWLQINVFNYFSLFGIIPNIGIVLVVIISLCAGKNIGAVVGFVYGLLFDCCFETSIGIYTALFCLVGYFVGIVKGKIALDNKNSLFIMVVVATVFIELAGLLVLKLKHQVFNVSGLYVLKVISLETIYNVFLAFLLYKPLMALGDIINRSRRAYYEL